jgi:hypothetical protein
VNYDKWTKRHHVINVLNQEHLNQFVLSSNTLQLSDTRQVDNVIEQIVVLLFNKFYVPNYSDKRITIDAKLTRPTLTVYENILLKLALLLFIFFFILFLITFYWSLTANAMRISAINLYSSSDLTN